MAANEGIAAGAERHWLRLRRFVLKRGPGQAMCLQNRSDGGRGSIATAKFSPRNPRCVVQTSPKTVTSSISQASFSCLQLRLL
eukprot:jgi/Tetstr1/442276/TSEL_030417.t1